MGAVVLVGGGGLLLLAVGVEERSRAPFLALLALKVRRSTKQHAFILAGQSSQSKYLWLQTEKSKATSGKDIIVPRELGTVYNCLSLKEY